MITNATFEALAELEEELEEEATELGALFSRGRAIAQPFGEEECKPDVLSPNSTRTTLKRFSRYSRQVLLNGRDADEPLWSVRRPRGGSTHRFVLTWVKHALELGGYNPRNMLTEWQIFWRRKDV